MSNLSSVKYSPVTRTFSHKVTQQLIILWCKILKRKQALRSLGAPGRICDEDLIVGAGFKRIISPILLTSAFVCIRQRDSPPHSSAWRRSLKLCSTVEPAYYEGTFFAAAVEINLKE